MMKRILAALCLFPLAGYSQQTFEVGLDIIFCGDTKVYFDNRCEGKLDNISFVHVHENGTTAGLAANWLLDSVKQGCFVTWKSQQQRFVDFKLSGKNYRFDPNRIFTDEGAKGTLMANGNYSDSALKVVRAVAKSFIDKYITNKKLVVALHNNTDGGGLSVNSYKKNAVYGKDAKQVFANPTKDSDDFLYTTELEHFQFLKAKGLNVVLQDNLQVKDDGSLSVFCAKEHIPYINIEAQEGHLQQQKEMLKFIWQIIDRRTLQNVK